MDLITLTAFSHILRPRVGGSPGPDWLLRRNPHLLRVGRETFCSLRFRQQTQGRYH